MSNKERRRLGVMVKVKENELNLAEAAEVLNLSYRQVKRIWKRYRKKGDAGLVHRSRGRPSARRTAPAQRQKILRRYRERYPDFGPTLASEHLGGDGWSVDHETLRRWLLAEGLWTVGRKRQRHRSWRERKACFGQMVQLDGSHHDWFEGRRAKAVLMVMIDDATNRTQARFFEGETTRASFDVFECWVNRYGVPQSLYVDRDSIYRCEREPTVAEQVACQAPQTQFGRAMGALGTELILAHSPQAKGRVERRHGLLQDRLVKALRLAGVKALAPANEFLDQHFLPELNRRFTLAPASPADVHRAKPRQLAEVLSWEEKRVVAHDWTVTCENEYYQIDGQHEALSLVGKSVVMRWLRSGELQMVYQGRKLHWQKLPKKPRSTAPEPRRMGRTRLVKPAREHPWRQFGIASGKAHWGQVKAQGRQESRAQQQVPGTSGRPSLRSGLPPVPGTC